MNPYFDYKKLELDRLKFRAAHFAYWYYTLCFWKTIDGLIYSASDKGCSGPLPFDDYGGDSLTEILQKLERVVSLDQAKNIFNAWNKDDNDEHLLSTVDCYIKLYDWFRNK